MITAPAEQLKLSDFDYNLPESLIAQEPCADRDRSLLMCIDRKNSEIKHKNFFEIDQMLFPGDLLVLNDTKVIPCRLPAKKAGGGKAEIFLVAEIGLNCWEALIKGASGAGKKLNLESGIIATLQEQTAENTWIVVFKGINDIREKLSDIGKVPLPPYIKRDATETDQERYQTVYAAHDGAVAAPTAGLHFTQDLLNKLSSKGVEFVSITLHVGPGTFQPVRTEAISEHQMMHEHYFVSPDAALRINQAKAEGRRVIAVGTTSVRTLETASDSAGRVMGGEGKSDLFIHPGYRFKVTDGMITNFHLPKSTLLMLVSAFAGQERIRTAYQTAVDRKYRFYSYGDAMIIV